MARKYSLFIFFAILLLAGLACDFSMNYSTAPAATAAVEQAPATESAVPEVVEDPAPFVLDANLYTHTLDAFSFYPPAGWTVDDTDPGGTVTWFTSPDEKAAMAITVINTGYELDDQAFANYVEAREFFFFDRRFEDVQSTAKTLNASDALTEKTFILGDVPQRSQTYYIKSGQAVYSLDYFSDEDVAEAYFKVFPEVTDKFTPQSEGVANLGLYNSFYSFTDQNNLYTIQVPAWSYEYTTDADVYIDTFTSPDGGAAVQTIVLDAKKTVTQTFAGQAALVLLNQFYTSGSGDIKISKDIPLPDGRERLEWRSQKSGVEGVTVFESRDNYLILFNVLYDSVVRDVFYDALDIVLDTYEPVK